MTAKPEFEESRIGRRLGALTQGLVLGVLLFGAILKLLQSSGIDQVFRYQGF